MPNGALSKGQKSKVTSAKNEEDVIKLVKEQLKEIRKKRATYKALQTEVKHRRDLKQSLLTKIESAQKELDRTHIISTYIQRKTEFFTTATKLARAGQEQEEITQDDRAAIFSVSGLIRANGDLLAQLTTYSVIAETEHNLRHVELDRQREAITSFGHQHKETESKIDHLEDSVESYQQSLTELEAHLHAIQATVEVESGVSKSTQNIIMYQLRQRTKLLDKHVSYATELNSAQLDQFLASYSLRITKIRDQNGKLYDTAVAAWRWTPTNRVISGLRLAAHAVYRHPINSEHAHIIEEHVSAVRKEREYGEISCRAFIDRIAAEICQLIAEFMRINCDKLELIGT